MKYLNVLKNQRLKKVYGLVYFEANVTEYKFDAVDIVEYSFIFDNNILHISGSPDGTGIDISLDKDIKELNMQEQGLLKKINLKEFEVINHFVEEVFNEAKKILYAGSQVGIFLSSNTDKSIIIINLGDELFLLEHLSKELIKEGYVIT